ncbi:hypothetical protein ABZX40_13350 [Streptomyces sp. NPDC004610]|uniref:hypothetical protein n=1 Tax=unclassified Streptomyces TaxID=2593676 RepID=UPI0033A22671
MDQHQRAARLIGLRQTPRAPRTVPAPVPDSVLADLGAIDAATDDAAIHAATARIRAALTDTPAKEA